MKKKQKTQKGRTDRRNKGQAKERKKVRLRIEKPYRFKKLWVPSGFGLNHATGVAQSANMPTSSVLDSSEDPCILPIFTRAKPIIAIESGARVNEIPNADIMNGAIAVAGSYVTKEVQGIERKSEIMNQISAHKFKYKDLVKTVLTKKDAKNWSVTLHFLDAKGNDGQIAVSEPSGSALDSKESALEFTKRAIAELILEDAKTNPKNKLYDITFAFGEMMIMIGDPESLNATKDGVKKFGDNKESLRLINRFFQDISDKLGGEFNSDSFHKLSETDAQMVQQSAAIALVLGKRKWPFD